MTGAVRIREVGPRDGFQNEPEVIPTDAKVELVDALARAGLRRLEVTSFVRADVITQLGDAREVLERMNVPDDVAVSVLVPNERGLELALALAQRERFDEVNGFLNASETHNRANVNRPIAASLAGLERMIGQARDARLRAEAVAALEGGCASFESSFGELGGCPVPAGATGNIATEDLVSMLHEMGIESGVDLDALVAAARRAQEVLGRPLGSHTLVAGGIEWHA